MFKKALHSIISHYLPYVSIALISCSAIGLAIFWLSVSELKNTAKEAECFQLQLAADDLDIQFEIYENIRNDIFSNVRYRPEYMKLSTYREVELLRLFQQYQFYSALCNNYFLYYPDSGMLFSNESKCTLADYFSPWRNNFLPTDEKQQDLAEWLGNLTVNDQGAFLVLDNDYFLFAYPINLTQDKSGPTAVLSFILNQSELLDRLEVSSGQLRGTPSLYYQDTLIAGSDEVSLSALQWQDHFSFSQDHIAIASDSGNFIIISKLPEGGLYKGLDHFRFIVIIFLCVSILFIALMTIAVIRRQYRPIRVLAEKVQKLLPHDDLNSVSKNEIKQIEHALHKIQQQSSLNQQQITDQIALLHHQSTLLRQQTLLMLLNGNANEQVLHQMDELQINLSGSFFCIFSLHFDNMIEPGILTSIEMLSDDDLHFYTVQISDTQVITVCNFLLESDADDATDLLDALSGSSDKCTFHIRKSLVVDSIDKLPVAYYSAQTSKKHAASDQDNLINNGWYHSDRLMMMLKSIREGNRENALDHLQTILNIMETHYSSALIQRNVIADVISRLINLSYELDIPIDSEKTGALLMYNNTDTVKHSLVSLLNQMFDALDRKKEQYEGDLSLRIRKYIDDHALDYDINLQRIAEEFQISTKQVNQYIRIATNQTYKEYELSIRIRKAHELLSHSSMTVAQISESIGYTDVSSFIKAFKNATGMTPATFRKNV